MRKLILTTFLLLLFLPCVSAALLGPRVNGVNYQTIQNPWTQQRDYVIGLSNISSNVTNPGNYWFKGRFNWTVNSSLSKKYLEFNGWYLDFNESQFNKSAIKVINNSKVKVANSSYADMAAFLKNIRFYDNKLLLTPANITGFNHSVGYYANHSHIKVTNATYADMAAFLINIRFYDNKLLLTSKNITDFNHSVGYYVNHSHVKVTNATYANIAAALQNVRRYDNSILLTPANVSNFNKTVGYYVNTSKTNTSWNHRGYPNACPAGSAITQLGDAVICTDTWLGILGDVGTGTYFFNGSINVTSRANFSIVKVFQSLNLSNKATMNASSGNFITVGNITAHNFSCTNCLGTTQIKDLFLKYVGGFMQGSINMNSNGITGVNNLNVTTVSGHKVVAGLNVSGRTNTSGLNVSGTSRLQGFVTLFNMSGHKIFGGLNISARANISGLNVSGTSRLTGFVDLFTVSGHKVAGNLNVSGRTNTSGANVTGTVRIGGETVFLNNTKVIGGNSSVYYKGQRGTAFLINTSSPDNGFVVYTNIGATANQPLVTFQVDNAAFDRNGIYIPYDGTQFAFRVDSVTSAAGRGSVIGTISASAAAASFAGKFVDDTQGTSLNYVELARQGTSTIGRNYVYGDLGNATTQSPLVTINQDSAIDDQSALKIQQDGTSVFVEFAGGGNLRCRAGIYGIGYNSSDQELYYCKNGAGSKISNIA